jgi:formate hydrogenlyase transcriptional activator
VTTPDPVVFVVDDDQEICFAVGNLLRSDGIKVETFPSAKEFLARNRKEQRGCLIVDMRLPGISGLDFPDELAKVDVDLPVVFLSEYGDIPTAVQAMKAGAADFLGKPFRAQELLDAVRKALDIDRGRYQQRLETDEFCGRFDKLASRERDVLKRIFAGLLNKQIAGETRPTGVPVVASSRETAFTQRDFELLRQLADRMATAADDAVRRDLVCTSPEPPATKKQHVEIPRESDLAGIVGKSSGIKKVLEQAKTVAATDATVLILGETGTGKDLIARAVHRLSRRCDRRFVKLNCAAIPAGLLESELFGHEKGAYTGAIAREIGLVEVANEGTLFLDEVGDIPLELQPKLLRVLEEREFKRVGSARMIRVDCRLVAATNRDLARLVDDEKFRCDLYYRLNVFPIHIPPLRKRLEDIPLLARHFGSRYAAQMNKRIETIPSKTMEALVEYGWPGNVRELQHVVERSVILSPGPALEISLDGQRPLVEAPPPEVAKLEDAERHCILQALNDTEWVIGGPYGAATRLGLRRTTLLYKMQRLGIQRPEN